MQYRCEILREFERLEPNLQKVDLEDVLSNGLKKYSKPILSLLKPKKKATFLQEVETTLNHFRPADQRKYEENCLTLAGILLLFQEKPEDLIKFQLDDECPIYILAKDKLLSMGEEEFAVYGEGCKLLGCEKFFQEFVVFIASIYVFNLVYPGKWVKSLTFTQYLLVGLKDQQGQINLDKRIVNVLASLNSLL